MILGNSRFRDLTVFKPEFSNIDECWNFRDYESEICKLFGHFRHFATEICTFPKFQTAICDILENSELQWPKFTIFQKDENEKIKFRDWILRFSRKFRISVTEICDKFVLEISVTKIYNFPKLPYFRDRNLRFSRNLRIFTTEICKFDRFWKISKFGKVVNLEETLSEPAAFFFSGFRSEKYSSDLITTWSFQ